MLLCSVSEHSAPGSVGKLRFDCRSYCVQTRRMQGYRGRLPLFIKTRPSPLRFLSHVVQACTQRILPTRERSRSGTGNEPLICHVMVSSDLAISNRGFQALFSLNWKFKLSLNMADHKQG